MLNVGGQMAMNPGDMMISEHQKSKKCGTAHGQYLLTFRIILHLAS